MTAEIVIMNKQAIALASDSAVTMTHEMGEKIKTSANKLFALSKYHPIGALGQYSLKPRSLAIEVLCHTKSRCSLSF
jgi:hypothetical protein